MSAAHPFDIWRPQWESARRRAAAGSRADAILSIVMLVTLVEANAVTDENPSPPGLPEWLVCDLTDIFSSVMKDGSGLEKAFHLSGKRGRNQMDNAQRDMEIDSLSSAFKTLNEFADAAERLGLEPPTPGEPWTADTLAKAMKAHARRIKSGLLFT